MIDKRIIAFVLVCMIVVSILSIALFIKSTPYEYRFAEASDVGSYQSDEGDFFLSQTFEWADDFLYGVIEQIGNIDDTKVNDGKEFGFRILWNSSPKVEMNFCFVLTYNAELIPEDRNDYRPVYQIAMRHNGSLQYKFSAIVSQLDNCPSEGWPFEIFDHFDNETRLVLSFDMVDDSRYFFIRDGFIDITLSFDDMKAEKGYITEVLLDYAPLEVYESLIPFG